MLSLQEFSLRRQLVYVQNTLSPLVFQMYPRNEFRTTQSLVSCRRSCRGHSDVLDHDLFNGWSDLPSRVRIFSLRPPDTEVEVASLLTHGVI